MTLFNDPYSSPYTTPIMVVSMFFSISLVVSIFFSIPYSIPSQPKASYLAALPTARGSRWTTGVPRDAGAHQVGL